MIIAGTGPPAVSPARNPVHLYLLTDGGLVTPEELSQLHFGFSGGVSGGSTFEIAWGPHSIVFTFVALPDNSGRQLREYTAGPLTDWVIDQITYFNRNYLLSRDFNITFAGVMASGPSLLFEAKQASPAFDLTTGTVPPQYFLEASQGGAAAVFLPRYRVVIDLQLEVGYRSDVFSTILTIDSSPAADMSADFEFSEVLRSKLAPELPLFNQTATSLATAMNRRWRVRVTESHGSPPAYQGIFVTVPFHAVLAGIDPAQWPGFDYPIKKQFLSWWPAGREKMLTPGQHEYLFFLVEGATVANLDMKAVVQWTDGSSTTLAAALSQPLITRFDLHIWPAGPEQLGLPNLEPLKTLESYTLQLTTPDPGAVGISEIRRYRIDYHEYPRVRHLLIRNSLGGTETLTLTGTEERESVAERLVSERTLSRNYPSTEGQYFQETRKGELRVTGRSGYHFRQEAETWADAILRAEAWEVWPDRYVPVIITNSKLKIADDLQDLWALELEWYHAFNVHSFTPRVTP